MKLCVLPGSFFFFSRVGVSREALCAEALMEKSSEVSHSLQPRQSAEEPHTACVGMGLPMRLCSTTLAMAHSREKGSNPQNRPAKLKRCSGVLLLVMLQSFRCHGVTLTDQSMYLLISLSL